MTPGRGSNLRLHIVTSRHPWEPVANCDLKAIDGGFQPQSSISQDAALSRRKAGCESRLGRHSVLSVCGFGALQLPSFGS